MDRSIIVEHLVKNFDVVTREKGFVGAVTSFISPNKRQVNAVQDISFSIKEGELVGFIGPNGAGKTTTMKILSGILYPTSGFVQVAGFTPSDRKTNFLKKIALVMGQKNQLWWDLPAIETFELNKAIYEIPDLIYRRALDELTSLLSVEDLLTVPVRRLSLGQRMRLELVAALLHQPDVVFLDEPTIGLDVIAQQKMRDFLSSYNKRHKATILLTSHNMNDLVKLTKRVIVIDSGGIVYDGSLSDLSNRYATEKTVTVTIHDDFDSKKIEKLGTVLLNELPKVKIVVSRKRVQELAYLLLNEFSVEDLTIEEMPIDEIIREVFKGNLKSKR